MGLSNTLFNTVTEKLKLKVSLLQDERFYIKNLLNQIEYLKKLKENNNYKSLSLKQSNVTSTKFHDSQDLTLVYIISISFLKANTTINVSDSKGTMKLFYSAGSVGLTGKQKKKRSIAVTKLISLLLKKATFLGKRPIALHLNNVSFYKKLIVSKLKRTLYIKLIKTFNQTPYNGCRKKKVRRKKYTKNFK
jgi:ribosomal protein S11